MILADITISEAAAIGLVIATIQFATLLYLAALGETIAERAGVLNLGVEGMMAVGAVTGYIAGAVSGSPWIGLLVGALGGALLASIHAFVAVGLGADQVVSGLALTILGLGLADYIGADYTGDSRRAWFADVDIPVLTDIPWVGETIFAATPVTYLAALLGVSTWFVLNRTAIGLGIRAAGESASTADAAGHSVARIRAGAVVVGGAFAGMSGAYLTNTLVGTSWSQGVTAGRGWIAVALVIFGAWRPGRVALGALLFGFTLALQLRLSGFGIDFSPILMSMAPFLMTIIVLIFISYRARNKPSPAPAAIGIPYRREER
ncbi:MAG: ABC transporter permease [Bosea sp.]|jgi:simple sugar transport system permease protein|uniref:ABC transporter permease n=1 Tax=Bosea sp. (in: a-proteobacteria) TaxID=1871050 RepID=UPI002391C5F8|nr:ABC transporter permease [Bosea sp. (in: a-proteobacteria)]MDG2026639.1 ABC transporter permease [Acidimicrobiales bacterium]